jgi:hypothetical protein
MVKRTLMSAHVCWSVSAGAISGRRRTVGLIAAVWLLAASGRALEIRGVEPFALDLPRVPAFLAPMDGGQPLTHDSDLAGRPLFAFDCYLDTGASRMVISRADRGALNVRSTDSRVEDYGIAGTETFDVSIPYRICVGDSSASTTDPRQFPHVMRCVLQLRRSDQNPLHALPSSLTESLTGGLGLEGLGLGLEELGALVTPSINIVGAPFLRGYVAILEPGPVETAMRALDGLFGGSSSAGALEALDSLISQVAGADAASTSLGRIAVRFVRAGTAYAPAQIVVPLTLRDLDPGTIPVSHDDVPFVADVTLKHKDRQVRVNLLVDTGGAMSLISSRVARELDLDAARPPLSVLVQGVGEGTMELRGHWVDQMVVPTAGGAEPLAYHRVPLFVADVAGIDGTIGANMLAPSVYMDMDMDRLAANPLSLLAGMRTGPTPFRRIVIDLPRGQLGLDPK